MNTARSLRDKLARGKTVLGVWAAVERILAACKKHGIVPGIQCGNGKAARKQADRGFRFVTFTKDSSLLPAAVGREVAVSLGKDNAVKQTSQKAYT
jgi:4-hydroxy-2-oxoheptanedioate aldolase